MSNGESNILYQSGVLLLVKCCWKQEECSSTAGALVLGAFFWLKMDDVFRGSNTKCTFFLLFVSLALNPSLSFTAQLFMVRF